MLTSVLVSCQTTIPKLPENAQDQVAATKPNARLRLCSTSKTGGLTRCHSSEQGIEDDQGKDSSYKFQSVYRESYLGKVGPFGAENENCIPHFQTGTSIRRPWLGR